MSDVKCQLSQVQNAHKAKHICTALQMRKGFVFSIVNKQREKEQRKREVLQLT